MDQEQELKYREQVQDGLQAQECLTYLKPILADIREQTIHRMEYPAMDQQLQSIMLDCRADIIGCRNIEDALKGRINAGKMAENTLKGGE